MVRWVILFACAFFVVYVPVSAQDTGPTSCPHLTQNLYERTCDENYPSPFCIHVQGTQVSALQRFLVDYFDLNPDDYISGYFGKKTKEKVRKFQCEQMQICSGDESTTGWGVVGRKTRDAIERVCSGGTTYSQASYYSQTSYGSTYTQASYNTTYAQSSYTPSAVAPSCTLSVSPTSIQSGGFAVLSWTSAHATSRFIDHGIGSVIGADNYILTGVTQTTTYTMNVTGPGGSSSCSTTLTVTAPPYSQASYYAQASYSTTYSQASYGNTYSQASYNANYSQASYTPPVNLGSCTYKGTVYGEGSTLSGVAGWTSIKCDNTAWVVNAGIPIDGADVCDFQMYPNDASERANFTCGSVGSALLAVVPRHGRGPLTVSVQSFALNYAQSRPPCSPFTISWEGGAVQNFSDPNGRLCSTDYRENPRTHTYASSGSYTLTIKVPLPGYPDKTNSANIRVDGNTASTAKQSQLASALAALESALKALLQLLGQ